MAKSSDLVTKIILKGQNDPSLKRAFQTANNLTDKSLTKLQNYGKTVLNVMKYATVGIGSGLVGSAKAAIDFESAFTGVMKTVDETATTTYEDLNEEIRELSKRMPASASEIAGVAEAAGQLGIKADDIMKFSETMVNLGETTNLEADVAATSIARLFNVTGTSMDMVDRFGATLVDLGNNAATTEAEIMEMAMRIAGSGKQIGLTEQQILALSTSLSSVGIEAEMGGSAISKTMTEIDKAVALNSDELAVWAETSGMTARQFKKSWGTDAYGTLQKVVKGMSDTKKEGGNLNILLEELGITEIRQSDTMKRLAEASGMMADMTNIANKAWEENSALTEEAQKRYDTITSKLEMFRNKIVDVGITIGNELLPYIDMLLAEMDKINWDEVANRITDSIDWVVEHFEEIKTAVKTVAGVFIAFKIGKFVKTMGQASKAVWSVIKACAKNSIITKLGNSLGKLGSKATSSTKNLKKVPKGIDGVSTSAGASVGQILASAAAFIALGAGVALAAGGFWVISKAAVSLAESGGTAIGVMFGMVGALAALTWGASVIGAALTAGSLGFLAFGGAMLMAAGAIWIISQSADGLKIIFQSIVDTVVPILDQFGQTVNDVLNGVGDLITSIGDAIASVIDAVAGVFDSMGNAALNAGKGFEALARGVKTLTNLNLFEMGAALIAVGGAVGGLILACGGIEGAGKGMQNLANGLMMIVMVGNSAISILNAFPSQVGAAISQSILVYLLSLNTLPLTTQNILTLVLNVFKMYGTLLNAQMTKTVNEIITKVSNGKTRMFTAGSSLAQSLANGIRSKINEVRRAAQELANASNSVTSLNISGTVEKVRAYAKGGTVTSPHMAVVGDAPETIVPHGNTPRNRALLDEAARGVGASYGNTINVTFAPVLNGGNAEENRKMLRDEEEEFERRMDAYFSKKERLSFNV